MKFFSLVVVLVSFFAIIQAKRAQTCVCPKILAPVCGANGVTYGNSCEAECAGIVIKYEGECQQKVCACPRSWIPVCGSDGKTYGHEKCAACAGVKIVHKGECEQVKECFCPLIYQPVCGVDGKNYSNKCVASCDKIQIAYDGECRVKKTKRGFNRNFKPFRKLITKKNNKFQKSCVCPEIYSPLCGINRKTYSNECELNCDKMDILHKGACHQKE